MPERATRLATASIQEAIVGATLGSMWPGVLYSSGVGRPVPSRKRWSAEGELHDGHSGPPLQAAQPDIEVVGHGHLIVAVALQEEERLGGSSWLLPPRCSQARSGSTRATSRRGRSSLGLSFSSAAGSSICEAMTVVSGSSALACDPIVPGSVAR